MAVDQMKTIPFFGYEIVRDQLLSTILGKHQEDVLYWAGKDLARKFPLFSMEEATQFFAEAGWGHLTLEKEKNDERIYLLTNDADLLNIEHRCFRLEAGFLAEQQQKALGCLTECYEEKNSKQNTIKFTVKSDLKEQII